LHPVELAHLVSHQQQHAPDLTVAAFMQLHQDFGGSAFSADQLQPDRLGASAGSISVGKVQSLFKVAQSAVIQIAVQHHFVGFVHFEAGVGETVSQLAIIG